MAALAANAGTSSAEILGEEREVSLANKKLKVLDPVKDFDEPVKRQEDLPGMENRGIAELEEAARKYAAIRDKRMALNDAEVKLQDILMALLKKHGKREYKHGTVEVWIKVTEEKVKVKIHEDDEAPSERKTDGIRDEANPTGANRKGRKATGPSDSAPQEAQPADRQTLGEVGASEGEAAPDEDIPF